MATAPSYEDEVMYATDYAEPGPKININFADAQLLTTIRGIGPRSAERILMLRETQGNLTPGALRQYLRVPVTDAMLGEMDFNQNPELSFNRLNWSNADETGSESEKDVTIQRLDMRQEKLREAADEIKKTLNLPAMRPDMGVGANISQSGSVEATGETTTQVRKSKTPERHQPYSPPFERAEHLREPYAPPAFMPRQNSGFPVHESEREQKYRQPSDPSRSLKIEQGPSTYTTPKPRLAGHDLPLQPLAVKRHSARYKLSPPRRRRQYGVRTDSGSDSDNDPQRRRRRQRPPILPKNLSYDGRGNFAAFKQKFDTYADAYDWSYEDCKNCLCWSLTGKASDFYSTITERDEDLGFRHIMQRLEKRFGAMDLDETAQVRFHQAMQQPSESLDDWADRVMTLANRALWDLPERHVTRQAVLRFCQGLEDPGAAQDVCIRRPVTMEEAIDHVKLFQNINDMMRDRKTPRRRHLPQEPEVYETTYKTAQPSPFSRPTPDQSIANLTSKFDKLAREMKDWQSTPTPPRPYPQPSQRQPAPLGPPHQLQRPPQPFQRPPQPFQRPPQPMGQLVCYQCGLPGHLRRECPGTHCYRCGTAGHIRRTCPLDLNDLGSQGQANPRPQ
ncbi:MAG: helix-hairpin-helix domain-containing protein [Sedimenticola sp.]